MQPHYYLKIIIENNPSIYKGKYRKLAITAKGAVLLLFGEIFKKDIFSFLKKYFLFF